MDGSVVLVAPRTKGKGGADIEPIQTPLTGLLTIATLLEKKGYEVQFYDELIKKPDYDRLDPDFLLISAMTATAKRAYEIADRFCRSDTTVVLGGLHPTFRPKEASKHADKVVKGEGEKVILSLLRDDYEEDIIEGESVTNLDSIPLPDYSLVEGTSDNPDKISICASRGCPYGCKFCSIHGLFGPNVRTVSNEKVIEHLLKFDGAKTICFDEPNFSADKERALSLLKMMREYSIEPKRVWVSVSLDVAEKEEILKLCSEVSDFNFTIGLESINKKAQNYYSEEKRFSVEKMRSAINTIQDYGIKIEGSFVFGSEHDEKDVFQNTLEFCQETEIEFPAFFPLTPYPGTPLREKLSRENRIFSDDWDLYDNLHTVFYPKNMTPYELQEGVISCYENYYTAKKGLKDLMKGKFFYGGVTFYLKYLFWRIKRQNKNFLKRLEKISDNQ